MKYTFKYDLFGNLLVSDAYNTAGKWVSQDTCIYNDSGYLTEKIRSVADDPERFFSTRYEYKYDKDGVMVEEFDNSSYHRDSISYKYDSYGNLNIKYIHRDKYIYSQIIRNIEYY